MKDSLLQPAAASAGLMIVLGQQGPMLPEVAGRAARALDLDDLELLARLGRGDELASVDPPAGTLLAELDARRLLASAAPSSPPPPPAARPATNGHAAGSRLVMATPVVLRVGGAGFEYFEPDGAGAVLRPIEVVAASAFRTPATRTEALARLREAAGGAALDGPGLDALVERLLRAGLLEPFDPADPADLRAFGRGDQEMRRAVARQHALHVAIDEHMAAHEAGERRRRVRTGRHRIKVIPAAVQWQLPPLALGMIMAYARVHDGGRIEEHYDLRPEWISERSPLPPAGEHPAVYLFSHYTWSSAENLALAARVKAANPAHVTIHGGPDVPKYDPDVDAYFAAHPHVDVAVRGEGEITTAEALLALAPSLTAGRPDLAALTEVPGLAVRVGERVVRTPERARITDLDVIPSPYLTGLFDAFGRARSHAAVVETNRGCPYGCTFCDWGSATASRIRQFSLERVFAELEWCARHGVAVIGIADANFGIFERDVEIARHVAELRRRHGSPRHLGMNYAKNSLKHLTPIVELLAEAGILSYGQVSLQTTDAQTLAVIDRANIKVQKYDELSREFRAAGLPLFVDLMMGLPGSTLDSFRNDLQDSIDREVIAKVHPTQLLVNSPMNEPSYRRQHGITAAPGAFVTSAASFSDADYAIMRDVRRTFLLLEKFGVLRQVARYVRHETGLREIDFYERLQTDASAHPERWPITAFTLEAVPTLMVPPGRWRFFLDEIGRFVVERLGVADDGALATVLRVQEALLPARHRRFPETHELAHDYAAWHRAMLDAKDGGQRAEWRSVVPALRSLPAGSLTIEDPFDVCVLGLGHTVETDVWGVWELASPVSRRVEPFHSVMD